MRWFGWFGVDREARRLWPLLLLTVVSVALAVAAMAAFIGDGPVSAKPLPRGSRVSLALPDEPGLLDRPAVTKTLNGVRAELKVPALTDSGCLDGVARSLVATLGAGGTPTAAPSGCGRVNWGWVGGPDRTGARQATAAYGRTPAGPSPLVSTTATRLGLAVGPRREAGAVTGYALVWVVSA